MAVDYEFPQCESVLATARHDPLTYQKLEIVLCDSNVHMTHRIRALFTLKAFKTEKAVEVIGKAFKDTSALLKHELAYVLGQMQLPCAIPILSARLEDLHEDPMVRHEAGEALGAIGEVSVLPLLKKYNSPELEKHPEVYQTCELAIELLNSRPHTPQWVSSNPNTSTRTYASIDPAPPFDLDDYTIAELHAILLNPKVSLFQRYRAMFTLRDIGSEEAVLMLKDGFKDTSALFRHEIAYVFGQLQHSASVPYLYEVLKNKNETPMVRHEAAEALGSVANEECIEMLREYAEDSNQVVRESCQVGIDIWEYERSGQLHYANSLEYM